MAYAHQQLKINDAELRVLTSLLGRLGMHGTESLDFLRERGVTDEDIAAAGLETEIATIEQIRALQESGEPS